MIGFRTVITKQLPKLCFYEQIRYIPRWSSRTPKKIHLPEEVEGIEKIAVHTIEPPTKGKNKLNYPTSFSFQNKKNANSGESKVDNKIGNGKLEILTLRGASKKKDVVVTDMLETVIDADGNLIYTKMNNNDARVARVLSNLKSEKSLHQQESILLEGKRLIREALKSGCKLQYILFSRKTDLEELKLDLPKTGAQLYKMPYKEMEMWSNLTTNPGIMGIFKIPEKKEVQYDIPVNVICDNVREPGNLGAILRTCAGVGCKKVILTKGCCDVWNSKVLRSAMGAHFKVTIEKSDWEEVKNNINDCNWFIADNNVISIAKASTLIVDLVNKIPVVSYDALKYTGSKEISLIIGGETEGISEEAYSLVASLGGMRLNIPLGNNIESLNSGTALGVLIFEMRRQIKHVT